MSTIEEKQQKAKEQMGKLNPTVAPVREKGALQRIPMSVPVRKLEVPEIPGFYLKWFRGTPQRLAQAERAGFLFVSSEEIQLNNVSLGGDATKDGNTDMGSRVSIAEGSEVDGGGNAVRLYLMKQPLEFYREDQDILAKRNDETAQALTAAFAQGRVGGKAPGETDEDMSRRYASTGRVAMPKMFQRKSGR